MIVRAGFEIDSRGPWIRKEVSDELDYTVDWTEWLDTDTILTSTWSVPVGLTLITSTQVGGKATAWLKDGVSGSEYLITNTITTTNTTPRKASQSFRLHVA